MTFSTLKTQLINLADDPAITDTQAGIWINANYKTLLREFPWPFLTARGSFTVTSGTGEYTFASASVTDFAKMIRVFNGNVELSPVNYDDKDVSGVTTSYYITPDNLSIGLLPTPTNSTDVITFHYEKSVDDMSNSTDTPVFFADFHWILVWKALMNYQFQQREQSDEFVQQYNDILRVMLEWYQFPSQNGTPTFAKTLHRKSIPNSIFGR